MKTKNSTRRSIGIFTKGLVHGFGQKLVLFPDFYFNENRPEKCVLGNSRKEETPF